MNTNRLRVALLENVNAILYLLGVIILCAGVAGWSRPGAAVVAGVVLMGTALWPYLHRRSRR